MHVAFNQDASCCVVGTSYGLRVYNCSPFGRFYASDDSLGVRGVGVAQMLFSTSLIVTVGNGEYESPRKLSIINTRKTGPSSILCELTFPTTVRTVRLNRQRLVVVLDSQIYIYNIANMKLLHTLNTALNKGGVADVTPTADSNANSESESISNATTGNWLVYPAGPPLKHHLAPPQNAAEAQKSLQGDVVVFDLDTLSPVTIVKAHRNPVAALALNEDGTLLATSSDRGTLVRVFSIPSGTLLYEFRRGSYQSHVYSIAFSLGSKLLCVSSATQTVHIYKLDPANRIKEQEPAAAGNGSGLDDLGDSSFADNSTDVGDESNASVPENHVSADEEDAAAPSGSAPSGAPPKKDKKSRGSWFSRSAWTEAKGRSQKSNSRRRDFAWFKLPIPQSVRTVLGVAPLSNLVYVATEDGRLFQYSIDMENGGECKQVASYRMS